LLEGLEVSIIFFKGYIQTYRIRLDSEYYLKNFLNNELKLKSTQIIKHFCKNKFLNIKSINLKKSFNYLEISNINLKGNEYRTIEIDFDSIPDRANIILHHNDIVISTVRPNRNAVALIQNPHRLVGTSGLTVLRLKKDSLINPYFLFAFCKTNTFITKLIRENTASMYPAVTDYDILNIFVPLFSDLFIENVSMLIKKSLEFNTKIKKKYSQAETLLLDTLGLRNFEPSNEPVNVKSFSESFLASGRLDAEYYQRKYEEIETALKRFSNGFTFVKNEFGLSKEIIDKTEQTYNYTEISDVNTSDGNVSYNEIDVTELPDNGKMKLKKGHLIVSKVRPYRGAVAIIREDPNNYVGSGAFTILEENGKVKKEVLQILLRTKPYQELIMKYNVGSSYPVVKDEDILNLPIPIIDNSIQQQIAEKIEESFRLKQESERLLDLAKRAVEVAIEEGEDAGMGLMKNEK